jgi:hypothetical protein
MGNVSKSDELISVTAFGKYILNPMNEVTISSSSNDISYINTGIICCWCWGRIQKTTFNSDSNNSKKLSAGLNASYLYSNQELNADKVNRETVFQVDFTKKENSLVHLIYY